MSSKFSTTKQRTGSFCRRLISASQFKTMLSCLARWAFAALAGIREPGSDAMEKGSEYHRQLEMYARYGVYPIHPVAKAGVAFCPAAGVAEAEVAIRFDTRDLWSNVSEQKDICWLGYADLVYDIEEVLDGEGNSHTVPRPVGTTGVTVIHDWKFTSKLEYAMGEDVLRDDPAANIYAAEAFLGGARIVYCRWVYITRAKKPQTREVWVKMDRAAVFLKILQMSSDVASLEINSLVKLRPKPDALPKNPDACFSFNRLCHYKEIGLCSLRATFKIKEKQMTQEFESDMMKSFPDQAGAVGATPPPSSKPRDLPPPSSKPATPPPSSKGAPPPSSKPATPPPSSKPPASGPTTSRAREIEEKWAKHAEDMKQDETQLGKPESGTYNSPEAPTTVSSSPEEAYDRQNLGKAVEEQKAEENTSDDLDNLGKQELIEYGARYGVCELTTKSRPPTILRNIRAWRKANPGKWEPYGGATVSESTIQAAVETSPVEVDARADLETSASAIEGELEKRGYQQPTKAAEPTVHVTVADVAAEGVKETIEHAVKEVEAGAGEPAFMLVVNGNFSAYKGKAYRRVMQHEIVDAVNKALDVEDWRYINFGKGAPELAAGARTLFRDRTLEADVVLIDTRTAAGAVLIDALAEFATYIFRGTT